MVAEEEISGMDIHPGMLRPEDTRIPESVREHFARFETGVAKVVPVLGTVHHEWWLFDQQDNLLDTVILPA